MTGPLPEMGKSLIKNQIEERIAACRQAAGEKLETLPVYPHVVYPGKPADIAYDALLYEHLAQAAAHFPTFSQQLEITASSLDRVPVLGRVWYSLRRQLHNVALFYANRVLNLLQHQVRVNLHLLEAVKRLTVVTQQQQRQIKTLQQQLTQSQETGKG